MKKTTHRVGCWTTFQLVALHSGQNVGLWPADFAVPGSTCSWRVTTYVGEPSAIGQPTIANSAFYPSEVYKLSSKLQVQWLLVLTCPVHQYSEIRHLVSWHAIWHFRVDLFSVICTDQSSLSIRTLAYQTNFGAFQNSLIFKAHCNLRPVNGTRSPTTIP